MRASRRCWDDESGFTLIEMIIATSIGVVVIGSLAASVIIAFRTTEEAGIQVEEAAWAQILGGVFSGDARSAETVTMAPASGACTGSPALVTFRWMNPGGGIGWVDWSLAGTTLRRSPCGTAAGPAPELVGVASATVVCASRSCTLAWTVAPSDAAPDRQDRTYRVTAARRVDP